MTPTPTKRMLGAVLPFPVGPYHGPDEIQRMQDGIARRSMVIDAAAVSCAAIDAATFQSWRLTGYIPSQQFAQEGVPSAVNQVALNAMFERAIAARAQLDGWAKKLSDGGCSVPLATPETPYGDLLTSAKWIGGALVLLLAGGIVVKVLNIVEDIER